MLTFQQKCRLLWYIIGVIVLHFIGINPLCAQTLTYSYRSLYTRYDSIIVGCMYGELCIPPQAQAEDTTWIEWKNDLQDGVDSSEDSLFLVSHSKPFQITDSTSLSFFRMILTKHYDYSIPYSIPDTTVWTMELWRTRPKEKLATIDSCGIAKATFVASDAFPDKFGYGATDEYHIVSVFLGDYASQAESVFIVFKIRNWAASASYVATMKDDNTEEVPYSSTISIPKLPGTPDAVLPGITKLEVFPNPVTTDFASIRIMSAKAGAYRLVLTDPLGRNIKRYDLEVRDQGKHDILMKLTETKSGVYLLRIFSADGTMIHQRQIIIQR